MHFYHQKTKIHKILRKILRIFGLIFGLSFEFRQNSGVLVEFKRKFSLLLKISILYGRYILPCIFNQHLPTNSFSSPYTLRRSRQSLTMSASVMPISLSSIAHLIRSLISFSAFLLKYATPCSSKNARA